MKHLYFPVNDVLSSLELATQSAHFPNLVALAKKLSTRGNTAQTQQFIQYGKSCVIPGLQYYTTKFTEDLSESVAAFKPASLFHKNC